MPPTSFVNESSLNTSASILVMGSQSALCYEIGKYILARLLTSICESIPDYIGRRSTNSQHAALLQPFCCGARQRRSSVPHMTNLVNLYLASDSI